MVTVDANVCRNRKTDLKQETFFFHSPKKILPFEVIFQTLNSVLPIYACAIYWTCSSFPLEKKVPIKWPKKFILKEKNIHRQTMSIYPLH